MINNTTTHYLLIVTGSECANYIGTYRIVNFLMYTYKSIRYYHRTMLLSSNEILRTEIASVSAPIIIIIIIIIILELKR